MNTRLLLTRLCATAGAAVMTATATPAALALPAGVSMGDVQAALSGPISVPAGQTTTISLPVAANASYAGGGWNVNAGGGSVTITAPAEGGQISVPVSYNGHSATITLVADPAGGGNGAAPGAGGSGDGSGNNQNGGNNGGAGSGDSADSGSGNGTGNAGGEGSDSGDQGSGGEGSVGGSGNGNSGSGNSNGGAGGAAGSGDAASQADLPEVPGAKPEGRKPAAAAPETGADYINIESTIEGNVITARLGVSQAIDLYNRFKNTDRDGVTLRYVDADGNVIQGVERTIDAAARTLTLTYPEGQAPDNPFIMQLVNNDGSGMTAVVTLRDPHYKSADVNEAGELPESATANESDSGPSDLVLLAAAGAGLLIILALIIVLVRRRRRPAGAHHQ